MGKSCQLVNNFIANNAGKSTQICLRFPFHRRPAGTFHWYECPQHCGDHPLVWKSRGSTNEVKDRKEKYQHQSISLQIKLQEVPPKQQAGWEQESPRDVEKMVFSFFSVSAHDVLLYYFKFSVMRLRMSAHPSIHSDFRTLLLKLLRLNIKIGLKIWP